MRTPTPDQEAVIASTARIRVVRAAPGSGKTWMVAETIRQELSSWQPGRGGIAALSFTRVGGDEIRSALGHAMPHPHFVGTIDAFLFRYVVRPHVRAVDPQAKTPDLIPADWQPADLWTSTTFGKRGINPYACDAVGRDSEGRPILAYVARNRAPIILEQGERDAVRQFKMDLLRKHGRMTVSDSALWASHILQHPAIGPVVRAEVNRRFPFLILDELQDTGMFLGESLTALLEQQEVRGLLVGDPDQAIYEFNGAVPAMFDDFSALSGAETLELRTSQRCPAPAAAVASHLKATEGPLLPVHGRTGRAILVRYADMLGDVTAIAAAYRRANPFDTIKIVARGNSTVDTLTGRSAADVPRLGCRAAALIQRAVKHFRCGRSIAALAAARAALELAALGGEAFTDDQLRKAGIEPVGLREAAIRCLLAANALTVQGSVLDWQQRAREVVMQHAQALCEAFCIAIPKALSKPQKREGHDVPAANSIPTPGATITGVHGFPVVTVHAVKGETHDVTIVVAPPTSGKGGKGRCPSATWWPSSGGDDEERRVAYVAFTRTRRALVVCVDEPAFARLATSRPEFVAAFECVAATDFLQQEAGAPAGSHAAG